MGGTGDWPLSGESTAMIAMATTAGILIVMIGCQNLRKVKSKKKVKVFIMNNVFVCLLVKTLHFGTLSLVNNSFCPFDKIHYYPSQKYNFYTVIWDLLSTYRYYWVHPGDVSDLYVLNFVYVQNSAQTYYVFNNVLPEEGTQSASIKVTTL